MIIHARVHFEFPEVSAARLASRSLDLSVLCLVVDQGLLVLLLREEGGLLAIPSTHRLRLDVDTPFLTVLKTWTSLFEYSVIIPVRVRLEFPEVSATRPASGSLDLTVLCLVLHQTLVFCFGGQGMACETSPHLTGHGLRPPALFPCHWPLLLQEAGPFFSFSKKLDLFLASPRSLTFFSFSKKLDPFLSFLKKLEPLDPFHLTTVLGLFESCPNYPLEGGKTCILAYFVGRSTLFLVGRDLFQDSMCTCLYVLSCFQFITLRANFVISVCVCECLPTPCLSPFYLTTYDASCMCECCHDSERGCSLHDLPLSYPSSRAEIETIWPWGLISIANLNGYPNFCFTKLCLQCIL
ncbi:hypothetical protein CsSME_00045527 [Camellia sinensis var. sinensis]